MSKRGSAFIKTGRKSADMEHLLSAMGNERQMSNEAQRDRNESKDTQPGVGWPSGAENDN